jgi:hypothetical protein
VNTLFSEEDESHLSDFKTFLGIQKMQTLNGNMRELASLSQGPSHKRREVVLAVLEDLAGLF